MAPSDIGDRARRELFCHGQDILISDPIFQNGHWKVIVYCGQCDRSFLMLISDEEKTSMDNDREWPYENHEY